MLFPFSLLAAIFLFIFASVSTIWTFWKASRAFSTCWSCSNLLLLPLYKWSPTQNGKCKFLNMYTYMYCLGSCIQLSLQFFLCEVGSFRFHLKSFWHFPPLFSSKWMSNAIPPWELGITTVLTLSCSSSIAGWSGGQGCVVGDEAKMGGRMMDIWQQFNGLYGSRIYTP